MNIKIALVVFCAFLLAGCKLLESGGDDSPKGITADLSHLKGALNEPDITSLSFINGRGMLINSQISGAFGATGNSHTFAFRALDSQLVSISIKDKSGSADHIKVYVTNPSLDDDEKLVLPSTLTAGTFSVIAGQTYEVSVFTFNGGSYTVTLADANRETMGLGSHEFYVSFVRTGEEQCNGRTTGYKPANLNFIFNFRNGSFVDNLNQYIQFDLTGEYTIGNSGAHSERANSSTYGGYDYTNKSDHWFTLDHITGAVTGEFRQESVFDYDDTSLETESCIKSTRFDGQILL